MTQPDPGAQIKYGERVAAERDSQEQPDDQAADAARTCAPEFGERGAR